MTTPPVLRFAVLPCATFAAAATLLVLPGCTCLAEAAVQTLADIEIVDQALRTCTRDSAGPQCLVVFSDEARWQRARARYSDETRPRCGDVVHVTVHSGGMHWSSESPRTSRVAGAFAAERCEGTFEAELETIDGISRITDLDWHVPQ